MFIIQNKNIFFIVVDNSSLQYSSLQCFDTVGWATGRAPSL